MTAPDSEQATAGVVPPPPLSDRLHPLARALAARPLLPLAAIAAGGALLLAFAQLGAVPHPGLARILAAFLLLYAAIVGITMRPSHPFGKTVDRVLEEWLSKGSTGFYGLMAFAMFCTLELRGLLDAAAAFEFTRNQLWSIFMTWLIGFSVDSMMNTIWASLWPWMLMKDHHAYAVGVMAAIGWGVYWVGARIFPHVHQRLERRHAAKRQRKRKAAEETATG